MGLTWAVGILVFEVPVLYPLAYIFTIFVAFQGVALFVLLNKPVREAYSKWRKIKTTKSEIYSRLFRTQSLTKVISSSIIPYCQSVTVTNSNLVDLQSYSYIRNINTELNACKCLVIVKLLSFSVSLFSAQQYLACTEY